MIWDHWQKRMKRKLASPDQVNEVQSQVLFCFFLNVWFEYNSFQVHSSGSKTNHMCLMAFLDNTSWASGNVKMSRSEMVLKLILTQPLHLPHKHKCNPLTTGLHADFIQRKNGRISPYLLFLSASYCVEGCVSSTGGIHVVELKIMNDTLKRGAEHLLLHILLFRKDGLTFHFMYFQRHVFAAWWSVLTIPIMCRLYGEAFSCIS